MINYLSKAMQGWLRLNQHCLLCRQTSAYLICSYCKEDISRYDTAKFDGNLLNNIAVRLGLSTINFDRLNAVSSYCWPLSELLTQLKFSSKIHNAKAVAQLFHQYAKPPDEHLPEALIPLPLHKSRFAQRKYNQAALIAKELAKLSGIRCESNILKRDKNTLPQTHLTASQRRKNTQNGFSVQRPIPYKHVALIDDVITTGATINAAADSIRRLYPQMQIDAWCICITPPNSQNT